MDGAATSRVASRAASAEPPPYHAAAGAGGALPALPAHNPTRRLLAGPLGALVARPWLDHVAYSALRLVFLPLSRLWAAADAAGGDVGAFCAAAELPWRHERTARLAAALQRYETRAATATALDAAWERVFFGAATTSPQTRVAVETARLDAADALNRTRQTFLPFLGRATPRARIAVATPAEVEALYPPGDARTARFLAPHVMPTITVSQPVATARGEDRWLRFESPSARVPGPVVARIHTPAGVVDPPTVVLGHGVCVEFDHWHGLLDETQALLEAGIRVIRPEAPWHGRRRPEGFYGGERAIGHFPLGFLDLLSAALQEWAVLASFARRTSRGPLGFGGTSLGALTAQLAASVAHDWPEPLRPQALYLMTHSASMAADMATGAVTRLFADPTLAAAHGWTAERAARLLAPIDPARGPVMPADRIVSVLGRRDIITPFGGGETLAWRWALPEANVFVWNNGHFTVPMRLARDHAPTRRFAAILKAL